MAVARDTGRYWFVCEGCGRPGTSTTPRRRFHNANCRKVAWRAAMDVPCTCDRERQTCNDTCMFTLGGQQASGCHCPRPLVVNGPDGGYCLLCGREIRPWEQAA